MSTTRSISLRLAAVFLGSAVAFAAARAQPEHVPPTDPAALLSWLRAGHYAAWPKESAPHRSLGSHQVLVVTHLNPLLDQSMATRSPAHPRGAAAVKALFAEDGKALGWAVAIKTADDSAGGKGWYWYEVLGTTPGSPVVANGHGVPLCIGCHARGRDAVLSEHPLD